VNCFITNLSQPTDPGRANIAFSWKKVVVFRGNFPVRGYGKWYVARFSGFWPGEDQWQAGYGVEGDFPLVLGSDLY